MGGKLNMSPKQIDAMSMWQFFAMLSLSVDSPGLTAAEADDIWEWMKSKE